MGTTIDPMLVEVCQREHARLVGMLALYVGDRGIAEELTQETLVRLHQHWPRVRSMASPRAWLSRVALNLARSWWRRRYAERRANQRVHATATETTRDPEPADTLAVRHAVAALPSRRRAALVLRFYTGLSIDETAQVLGCAPGTVKSLTHRALAELRRQLDVADNVAEPEMTTNG